MNRPDLSPDTLLLLTTAYILVKSGGIQKQLPLLTALLYLLLL